METNYEPNMKRAYSVWPVGVVLEGRGGRVVLERVLLEDTERVLGVVEERGTETAQFAPWNASILDQRQLARYNFG